MPNGLIVSLYILGVFAAGMMLLSLVVDTVWEHFSTGARPLPLTRELGYELARWIVVITVIAFAFVGVLRFLLFVGPL
jgi:hypothetical protein